MCSRNVIKSVDAPDNPKNPINVCLFDIILGKLSESGRINSSSNSVQYWSKNEKYTYR